jgi:hypothetical protein
MILKNLALRLETMSLRERLRAVLRQREWLGVAEQPALTRKYELLGHTEPRVALHTMSIGCEEATRPSATSSGKDAHLPRTAQQYPTVSPALSVFVGSARLHTRLPRT